MKKNLFKIYPNIEIVATAVAEEIFKLGLQAQNQDAVAHISLSGGSTPKKLFEILAQKEYLEHVPWQNLCFWWGDERLVPYDSPDSNYGEAHRILFSKISPDNLNVEPVSTDLPPENAVGEYEDRLRKKMGAEQDQPIFDWMILGLGDDGHTASLFAKGVDLDLDDVTALATHPTSGQLRVSLTLKAINSAKRISFLVTGASKANVLKNLIEETGEYKSWPSHAVANPLGQREWFLDKSAGKNLNEGNL